MNHSAIVVHDGRTYLVILRFDIREGHLAVSVVSVTHVSIMGTKYS